MDYLSFDDFSVYLDSDTIIIDPSVTYDNDEATKSRYVEEVKDTIDSLALPSDYYKYYVRTAADINYSNLD